LRASKVGHFGVLSSTYKLFAFRNKQVVSSDSENDDEVRGSSLFHFLSNHCSAPVLLEPFSSSPKSFTSNTSMVSNDSTFTNLSVDRSTTHVTDSPALTGRFSSSCDACVLDCFFDLAC